MSTMWAIQRTNFSLSCIYFIRFTCLARTENIWFMFSFMIFNMQHVICANIHAIKSMHIRTAQRKKDKERQSTRPHTPASFLTIKHKSQPMNQSCNIAIVENQFSHWKYNSMLVNYLLSTFFSKVFKFNKNRRWGIAFRPAKRPNTNDSLNI